MTTGGDRLVANLRARGVDTIFALPGIQLDPLFDALARQDAIRVFHTRHEQAAAYMADGYARASGSPGVCVVVPGPGVLNAGAALSTAYATCSPVLCIAGDMFGGDAVRGTGALHEIPDQSKVFEGTIDWTRRVLTADEIDQAIADAFARMAEAPSRPAAIEIGPAALGAETAPLPDSPLPPLDALHREVRAALTPDSGQIEVAAEALAQARRPVIYVGGGGTEAGTEIRKLAEALNAPIVMTAEGKGTVDEADPRVVPLVGSFALLDETDGLVVIGSRFTATVGPPRVNPDAQRVRIDTNERRFEGDWIPVQADAAQAVTALTGAVTQLRPSDSDRDEQYSARVGELQEAVAAGLATRFPDTWGYCQSLRSAMSRVSVDAVLVDEMTQVGYMARNAFITHKPRTHIGSGYQGTLGFGYPTALGAKVAVGDTPVVSINGDGGFLYNIGELATAMHHGIGVVAVVFSDNAYGNVKGIQKRQFGREIASTLTNPDFVKLANSFDMRAATASNPAELDETLGAMLATNEPALISVAIDEQPDFGAVMRGTVRL